MNENNSVPVPAVAAKPELISFDALLSASWKGYKRNFVNFLEMYLRGLVGLLPLLAVGILAAILFLWLNLDQFGLYILIGILGVAAILWSIYYGVRAKIGSILILKTEGVSVKENFEKSKSFFWAYLVVSVATSILIFLAFLLLIVPGIILAVFWAFVTILVVLEDKKSVGEAIKRSKELVKGYWWPVFGRFLFIGLIAFLISMVLSIPLSFFDESGKQVFSAVTNVFWALVSPFFLVYSYLLYKDLDAKKKA